MTTGTIDPHVTHNPVYEAGYAGHWLWDYSGVNTLREWWKLKRHVVERVGLRKGAHVLEVACGQGFHVNLLRRMGYRVTGIDISEAGIRFAKARYPDDDFRLMDAAKPLPFPDQSFDLVWSHGAGFFHYDIEDKATEEIVRSHLRLVKPGGHYLVMIASDLSGHRPTPHEPQWATEWVHTHQEFRSMLGRHEGEVTTDWFPVRRAIAGPPVKSGAGYIVGTLRRPRTRRPA